jgi:hypothetical protein
MIRRYTGSTETIANLRSIDRNGEETNYEDCVTGISLQTRGVFQIDLRNLRPIRLNDRAGLIIELDVNEVMGAIAEGIREAVKE